MTLRNCVFRSPDAPGRYVYAGERRPPRKGEFYLSGARPCAYRAPNDFTQSFHIARLVPGTDKPQPAGFNPYARLPESAT